MGQLFWRTRAKLHERPKRRRLMFWLTLTLLLLSFAGQTVLQPHLATNPLAFLFYWTAVTLLAIGLVVLSGYDMLRLPRELRRENRSSKPQH